MKKNPRNFVVTVFVVVFVVAALSVSSMVKNVRDGSFEAFAEGSICTAQGDIMPESFDDVLIAPATPENTELYCSAQGPIPPVGWDDSDDETDGK
jgi:hypothetical protein